MPSPKDAHYALPLICACALFFAASGPAQYPTGKYVTVHPEKGEGDEVEYDDGPTSPPPPPTPTPGPSPEITHDLQKVKLALQQMKRDMDVLRGRVELLNAQLVVVARRTSPIFENQTFVRFALGVVRPSAHTFSAPAESGAGAYLGAGHYFGKSFALDLDLDYDIYLAATLRARYDFHPSSLGLTVGPIVGVKEKLLGLLSWGNYIARNELVSASFLLVGASIGVPVAGNLLTVETDFLTHGQTMVDLILAFHVFL